MDRDPFNMWGCYGRPKRISAGVQTALGTHTSIVPRFMLPVELANYRLGFGRIRHFLVAGVVEL